MKEVIEVGDIIKKTAKLLDGIKKNVLLPVNLSGLAAVIQEDLGKLEKAGVKFPEYEVNKDNGEDRSQK